VIIANPEVLKNASMAKLFNRIIATAGLDPIDFGDLTRMEVNQEAQPTQPVRQPVAQPA
jgi:hypothetical protein